MPEQTPIAPPAVGTGTAVAAPSRQVRIGFNHTNLDGWRAYEVGGSGDGKGSIVPGSARLTEGDSFLVGLDRSFVVPPNPSPLVFTYTDLDFDTTDPGSIHDAFEVSLVDPAGMPLVHPFGPGREAFFNVSEGVGLAVGPGVDETGAAVRTVTLDLSEVPSGALATVHFRLVNNDQDTETTVTILDVFVPSASTAPTLDPVLDQSSVEGTTLVVAARFTDPDASDAHTAVIDWGDGTSSQGVITPTGPGTYAVSASHDYADDGHYHATLTVADSAGGSSSRIFAAEVANAAPQVTAGVAFRPQAGGAQLGVVMSGEILDPGFDRAPGGSSESFSTAIDWGDGTVESVPVTTTPGGEGRPTRGRFEATHTFAKPGVYSAQVTVRDDDDGTGSGDARFGWPA